jgi:hypothetical protein
MRLSEAVSGFDKLSGLWGPGSNFEIIAIDLMAEPDEDAQLLGRLLKSAVSKHTSPQSLLPFLNNLAKIQKSIKRSLQEQIQREISIYISALLHHGTKADFKLLMSKADVELLAKTVLSSEIAYKLLLTRNKLSRTAQQIKHDKDHEIYVFIGRSSFKEVPPGSGNYKKQLEIERLVKIDKFKLEDLTMISQMQLRAKIQGDSSLYKIELPTGSISAADKNNPPDWLIQLIDEHKVKIN